MKKLALTLLIVLAFISCKKTEEEKTVIQPRVFENWIELIIPNGGEALAIAGDISDTLLVSTSSGIYYTIDSGQSWQLSQDFNTMFYDIIERSDTIFLLEHTLGNLKDYNGSINIENVKYSKMCTNFTTDFGKTWQYDNNQRFIDLESPIGITESKSGVVYRLIHDLNWLTDDSYTVNFSDIQMYNNSRWQTIDFPLDYELKNLHVDKNNILYVTAETYNYYKEFNLQVPDQNLPALIYVYKLPVK